MRDFAEISSKPALANTERRSALEDIYALRFMELFAIPVEVERCPILLRASIGGAVYPDHGEGERQLWQDADAAMRRAKRDGGGRYLLAAQETSTDVAKNLELEDHMRTMLQEGDFACTISCNST
jgi:predicted signal transduction protein with EAL and GGDEF domain